MTAGASNRGGIFGSVAPAAGAGGMALLGGWYSDNAGTFGPFGSSTVQNLAGPNTAVIALTGNAFIVDYAATVQMTTDNILNLAGIQQLRADIQVDGFGIVDSYPTPLSYNWDLEFYDLIAGNEVYDAGLSYGIQRVVTLHLLVTPNNPAQIPHPPFYTPTWFVPGNHNFQPNWTTQSACRRPARRTA